MTQQDEKIQALSVENTALVRQVQKLVASNESLAKSRSAIADRCVTTEQENEELRGALEVAAQLIADLRTQLLTKQNGAVSHVY